MPGTYVRPRRRSRRSQTIDARGAAKRPGPLDGTASPRTGRAPAERVDRETAYVRALFFHAEYVSARLNGVRKVRAHVAPAWEAEFGTPLSQSTYDYYVSHPDHARIRVECMNAIVTDGLTRLLAQDVRLNLVLLMQYAKHQMTKFMEREYWEVTGCTVITYHVKGEAREEKILHTGPPAKLIQAFAGIVIEAIRAQFKLQESAYTAVAQAARTQGLSPGRVLSALSDPRIGKASPGPTVAAPPSHAPPSQFAASVGSAGSGDPSASASSTTVS